MKNHGKQILKDIHRKTFIGGVKSTLATTFWFAAKWVSVAVFVTAGWFSMSDLVYALAGQLQI